MSATAEPTKPLTKKDLTADHPTWCPGCGDFAVLAAFFKVLEKLQIPHEKICTIPCFVNGHGVHFIHGRALPLATGISLSRPDLHVFAFGGDGDGYSIGGNHLDHAARKNINLTYIVMDNFVYGLTKKQTSPTSPQGFKSKTDPTGAIDQPVNPMKKLVYGGASFVARTHAGQVKRKWDNTPEDSERHDVSDENAAYQLASLRYPGKFGVFYETYRPTKNQLEQRWIDSSREKVGDATAVELLSARFASMK